MRLILKSTLFVDFVIYNRNSTPYMLVEFGTFNAQVLVKQQEKLIGFDLF